MSALQAQQLCYFGKLPGRGDFVKGLYNPQLIKVFDNWLSQTMEMLSEDPRWKIIYDNAAPIHFVCLGSRSRVAIAGHLKASRDESSRRYPFLAATSVEVDEALDFMRGAPMLVGPYWDRMAVQVNALAEGTDLDSELKRFEALDPAIETGFKKSASRATYAAFTRDTSLLRIEQMLNFDGHKVSLRRAILALGLLLQPVMASAVSHLEKGLTLPLPRDPVDRSLIATFWLELVSQFLAKADFELVLMATEIDGRSRLVIGFNGLSPRSLQSVLHPQVYTEHNIDIDNPEWVEDTIHSNYAMFKLVSYLDQPQLPLDIVLAAFREVFIGE